MKSLAIAAATAAALAQTASTGPPTRHVGTISDLMIKIIYPASDAVFYIESRTPKTDSEWGGLEAQALMLAESANLLMMPGRARDAKQWMTDSRVMLDAAADALAAARRRDVDGIVMVGDRLLQSCTSCHERYRPDYGKPRG